jgi:thioredoxin reductase (NADPH)
MPDPSPRAPGPGDTAAPDPGPRGTTAADLLADGTPWDAGPPAAVAVPGGAVGPAAGGHDPSDPYARAPETFPRLSDEQVRRVAAFGTVEDLPRGTVLFRRDDRGVDFFLVLEGHVEIYEEGPGGRPEVMTVHARHQFTGELDLFNDRAILVGGRMGVDGRVARLSRPQFRRMLAAEPDVAEIVLRAFLLRRAGFIAHGQAAVTIVGPPRSGPSVRLQTFLTRNGHPYLTADPASDPGALALLEEAGVGEEEPPVVLCGASRVLVRPSVEELADCLGISEPLDPDAVADVAVVGAGPAGLASAVYAASEGLDTLVLEAEAPGGQAGTSSRIENYLGFPVGVSGQSLAARAQVQAQKFGARIAVPRRVTALEGTGTEGRTASPYRLRLADGTVVRSRTVVVATGARYRSLSQVPDIDRFEGNGIHYAATAVEAALCGGEEVAVVGGGNSAGQAAVFLSRHARHVHVLIRGESLAASMSEYLSARIAAADRITLHPCTEITAVAGRRHLEQVTWTTSGTGAQQTRAIANVFLMLGAVPNTEWLQGAVALDGRGFVPVGAELTGDATGRRPGLLETDLPGVYAVGDVRASSVKRVASAVGEGSIVVSQVHAFLAARGAAV